MAKLTVIIDGLNEGMIESLIKRFSDRIGERIEPFDVVLIDFEKFGELDFTMDAVSTVLSAACAYKCTLDLIEKLAK